MSKPLPLPPGLALRVAAAERLRDVLGGARFVPLGISELADGRDRALANRLVTTALRRHGHLNLILDRLLERGMPAKSGSFEPNLRLALAQLLYLPEIGEHSVLFLAVEAVKRDKRAAHLAKLMNAVLRKAQGEADLLREPPPALLFPEPLRRRWAAAYGEAVLAPFGEALLAGAPLDLTLRETDDGTLATALNATPILSDQIRLETRDRRIEELDGYAEGRWWVQDVAASLPARLIGLPAGARVLDVCAAPGGKTAQLVKAGYEVTALDIDPARLERLNTNLARLGLSAETIVGDGLTYAPEEKFDAVLLDAPCSATGTFRRHPEVVWHRGTADIAGRVALQRRLLAHAVAVLKPGGTLVYCVCSLEPEEGEAQAEWALATLPDLTQEPIEPEAFAPLDGVVSNDGYLRTHPGLAVPAPAQGTLDGFFAGRFRKA